MTLTIHKEEDNQRQLNVTVEVAEERVQKAMRQTARKLARNINIPGFRKGKIPYNVLLSRIGEESLRIEAVEDEIPAIFDEVLKELDVELYGRPSLDDMEMEPLVLKFTLPLTPTVKLGDYRSLRKEVEPVTVTDEAVEEVLEDIRVKHQELQEVDRPSQIGDVVTISGKGELAPKATGEDGDETEGDAETAEPQPETFFESEDGAEILLDPEKVLAGTPFVENLVGLTAGDEKSFSFTFPEDYEEEDLAGREVTFNITVLNVKERILPELNDDLAKLEGEYETLDELREAIRNELHKQAEQQAKDQLIESMVDDLLEQAEIIYPPAAVEMEIDEMMEEFQNQVRRGGWEWEDFLKIQGKTEEQVREDFRESAEKRLKRRLVLRQFVLEEKLTVDQEDVDNAIEERVKAFAAHEELQNSMRQYYQAGYGFEMVSSEVLMDKTAERIKAILSGNAPDLSETAETENTEEE